MTRPEMIENGLKFLRHPNVQSTPLSERVSFLEQKGMAKDEIQEALERYQSEPEPTAPTMAPAQAVVAAAPMVAAVAGPAQQLARRHMPTYMRVLLTISSVVGAATLLGFLWNYMAHAGFFPWLSSSRRLLEAPKPDEDEAEKEKQTESVLLTSLESVSSAIQSQTQELSRLCTAIDTKEDELTRSRAAKSHISSSIAEQATVQAIAELKAEVSTLKALLVASTSGIAAGAVAAAGANVTSTGGDSGQAISTAKAAATATAAPAPVVAEPVVAEPTAAERMMTALKKFRQENTTEQLKSASGILIMYVKNLVENPDVPRYRRIATTNANFKQKIEPLKHHDELLKSIGFAPSGLNMEWTWHHINRDEHIAILKALLKALQAVSSAKSNDPLALEEIAQKSMDEFYAQEEKKASSDETETTTTSTTADSSVTTTTTTTTATVEKSLTTATKSPVDTDLQSFISRLEQKTSKSLDEKNPILAAAAEANPTVEAAGTAEVDLEEEKAPIPVTTTEATPSSGEPPYPKSFTEVMELIKKGEPVPGIQQIEERISDDAAKFLSEASEETSATAPLAAATVPAKPWEKR